ncbi:carboxylesterase, partial [Streptomyces sp. C]
AGAPRPAPSHLYEFRWPSGVPGLGACHALELGFVFDSLRKTGVHVAGRPGRPAGAGRRDARRLGPFRRHRGPRLGALGRRRPAEVLRRAGAGGSTGRGGRYSTGPSMTLLMNSIGPRPMFGT